MVHAVNAERIKLLSTKSPYWCVAIVAVVAILFSVLIGLGNSTSSAGTSVYVSDLTVGMTQIGVVVLMIMAVLAVTSEFRFGTIRTTFQAIPSRETVLGAKAVVYGGVAVVVSFVVGIVSMVLGKALSGDSGGRLDLAGSEAIRQYWGIPVYTLLCILIGLGIGAIVRQSAGAIVVLLIWSLVLENILINIPKVKVVAPYMPFTNASRFLTDRGSDGIDYVWNAYGSILYFAVVALVIFGIGVVLTKKRDA